MESVYGAGTTFGVWLHTGVVTYRCELHEGDGASTQDFLVAILSTLSLTMVRPET